MLQTLAASGVLFPVAHRTRLILSKTQRTERAYEGLRVVAITKLGIPTAGGIEWSYPLTGQQGVIRGTPPTPAVSLDGWLAVTPSKEASHHAGCLHSVNTLLL